MYEEQEAELEALKERHSTTEAYVEELRARVGKLVERESSTEVRKRWMNRDAYLITCVP